MITFSSVTKTYEDGTKAIQSLDFNVRDGEFFVLIGPSGCGKTTTMKMINRLIEPTSGEIRIQGQEIQTIHIHELRWNIGYVLQQIALFPHMTIAENIAVVPEMRRWDKKRIQNRVNDLLEMVGMDPSIYRERKPAELSGGQQQRVGVVRALAGDPDIILMDEPFSALDPLSREQLQQDIRNLQQEIQKTIVFVTHDMDEALTLGDRICLMREGEVVQIDTPQHLILQPNNAFVRRFIGDRKNAWLTAVDVMLDSSGHYLAGEDEMGSGLSGSHPVYIQDKQGRLKGEWDGQSLTTDVLVIDNHVKLREAVQMLKKAGREALPVVKDGQVLGVLSHQGIVDYLERESRDEKAGRS
ncbi:ABC transporter ATP-binding protein [Kroppenstedtia pulmonis]|uniref:Quaternary amine transport ATP-binding protein n=1 Tax=Kroppenstedtia pulmonis TaxID=1380685 RepID=A0A7D3XJW5_9BACL|nr:ABC transporter ATP-binding protein [Kroppenstedtia pulmonis]QKG85464.1 ABC transporter ATP-binding protein [Kroppenstedtia pulmonis]